MSVVKLAPKYRTPADPFPTVHGIPDVPDNPVAKGEHTVVSVGTSSHHAHENVVVSLPDANFIAFGSCYAFSVYPIGTPESVRYREAPSRARHLKKQL